MHCLPILIGKSVSKVSRVLNKGTGSTWPGHVALKIDSKLVQNILKKNPELKIILVAGTNGKTTTTKLVQEVLEDQGKRVFRNAAGANLLNGIASSLIKHSNLSGKINYNVAVFEVDENNLFEVISNIQYQSSNVSIILLNLFRDQLDRYGEVNSIAKKWKQAMKQLNNETILITNGDDPMLTHIGQESGLDAYYFGLDEKYMKKKEAPHDVDFLFCPDCGTELIYSKRSYSHMGIFKCPECGFKHQETATFEDLPNPMFGIYNKYNINAAALLLQKAFGIDPNIVRKSLEKFAPAFGRQEKIEYQGKSIFLLLSKNPTGFNQSIEAILSHSRTDLDARTDLNAMLLLNDRIPDGKDVSWIWDVEFEQLVEKANSITISGDRAYDMGLRVKYSFEAQNSKVKTQYFNSKVKILENLQEAINTALSKIEQNETLYILATYSAMLETRKILKGHAIL